jgi:hypothetical protein
LRGGKRRIDRRSAGQRRRELLTDAGADTLELRNRRVLHPDIRHWLNGRLVRIGGVDRRQRQLREWCNLQVFRILVERGSGAGRDVGPALLRGDELGVVLAGSPGDEFFRGGDVLRTCRDGEIPRPQPVGILSQLRRERETTLSATLESFGLVTEEAATVASIHIAHLPELNRVRFSLPLPFSFLMRAPRAVVGHLKSSDLEELPSAHPSLSWSLHRLEAGRVQILLAALQQYSLKTMEQRLATSLLLLADKFGVATPGGLKIDLNLPQETLAKLIGSRQRVKFSRTTRRAICSNNNTDLSFCWTKPASKGY